MLPLPSPGVLRRAFEKIHIFRGFKINKVTFNSEQTVVKEAAAMATSRVDGKRTCVLLAVQKEVVKALCNKTETIDPVVMP